MKLTVFSNPDCHVSDPNHVRFVGNPAGYIGRRYDPETGTYPLKEEPTEFEAEGRPGQRVLKLLQRGELLPADEATADAAGVELPASDESKRDAASNGDAKPEAPPADKATADTVGVELKSSNRLTKTKTAPALEAPEIK